MKKLFLFFSLLHDLLTILHINNSNAPSPYLLSIARRHDRRRFKLIIGCFDKRGPLHDELDKLGVENFFIPVKSKRDYLQGYFNLRKILKHYKPDVLHLHTFYPALVGLRAGRMAKVPKIILTRHHADQHWLKNKKWHIRIDSYVARKVDTVIAVSDYTRKILCEKENVPSSKVKVIPHGIEELQTLPGFSESAMKEKLFLPRNSTVLMTLARLHPDKNLLRMAEAFKLFQKKYPDAHWVIAGAGVETGEGKVVEGNEYFQAFHARLTGLGLIPFVRFTGFRTDIPDLLHTCDALLHPSLSESFGFSCLEAMSIGKNVIASDIPAVREVISPEIAYLFDPLSVDSMLEAMEAWKRNPAEAARRSKLGVERYRSKFTFERMIREYEALYEE